MTWCRLATCAPPRSTTQAHGNDWKLPWSNQLIRARASAQARNRSRTRNTCATTLALPRDNSKLWMAIEKAGKIQCRTHVEWWWTAASSLHPSRPQRGESNEASSQLWVITRCNHSCCWVTGRPESIHPAGKNRSQDSYHLDQSIVAGFKWLGNGWTGGWMTNRSIDWWIVGSDLSWSVSPSDPWWITSGLGRSGDSQFHSHQIRVNQTTKDERMLLAYAGHLAS